MILSKLTAMSGDCAPLHRQHDALLRQDRDRGAAQPPPRWRTPPEWRPRENVVTPRSYSLRVMNMVPACVHPTRQRFSNTLENFSKPREI